MNKIFKILLILTSFNLLLSCNVLKNTDPLIIDIPKTPEPAPVISPKETDPKVIELPKGEVIAAVDLSYAKLNENVFKAKCLQCHSGKYEPSLTTYAAIIKNKEKIYEQSILSTKMPKTPLVLTNEERWHLKTWLDSGAPEFAADGKVEPPPVIPPPVIALERPVKWDKIKTGIIDKSCVACHFAGNKDGISSYEDYETTKATIGTIFFYTNISSAMPPAPADLAEGSVNPNQLTSQQKDLLSAWITDGMKQ